MAGALTQEEIQELQQFIEDQKKGGGEGQPATPTEPAKIKVKWVDGSDFEGTQEDFQRRVDELRQQSERAAQAEALRRNAALEAPKATPAPGSEDEVRARFNAEFEKRAKAGDPYDAFRYATEELIFKNPDSPIHKVIRAQGELAQVIAAESFVRDHPEFPQGDQRAAEVMNQIIVSNGYNAYTKRGLEDAWRYAVDNDLIVPKKAATEPEEPVAQRKPKAPPRVNRSAVVDEQQPMDDSDMEALLANMTDEQLEAYARKKGYKF